MKKIIEREQVFMEDFVPDRILFRDKQIQRLKHYFKPNMEGSVHVFLHGPAGTGKTTVLKQLLAWLNETSGKILAVYIDCTNCRTTNAVFQEILSRVSNRIIPLQISNYRLTKMIGEESRKRRLIVCLDDFGWLKEKEITNRLLRLGCSLVLAADKPHTLEHVGHLFQDVDFQPYSENEAVEILRGRAILGLSSGSCNNDILSMIASACNGNMKIGISVLWRAARKAQDEGKSCIEANDVVTALNSCLVGEDKELKGKLSPGEQLIHSIIEERGQIRGTDVQRFLEDTLLISGRTTRNHLRNLVSCGLVKASGSKRSRAYRTM